MTTGVLEVGGAGTIGLAFETTYGAYLAPTKWVPVRSESLQQNEDKVYRMNIKGVADRSGAIKGYFHVEGDLVFEVSGDVLLYFLYAARCIITKSAGPPYTYTFKPAHIAKATTATGATTRKTLSVLTQRSQNPMGYLGLSVGQLAFSLDNGVLVCTAGMVGSVEAPESSVSPSFAVGVPFGPGDVTLEIPSGGGARSDVDTFNFTINDNLSPANRLNGQRGAAYQTWGEREITVTAEHDFANTADFDIFVANTFQVVKLLASHGASDQITVLINAAVEDSYQVNLSGLGDVVRGSIAYHGIYDTTDSYQITVVTTESIT